MEGRPPDLAKEIDVPELAFERSSLQTKPIGARTTIASVLMLFALFFFCVYLLPSLTCDEREHGGPAAEPRLIQRLFDERRHGVRRELHEDIPRAGQRHDAAVLERVVHIVREVVLGAEDEAGSAADRVLERDVRVLGEQAL